jgi:hypothetical protein
MGKIKNVYGILVVNLKGRRHSGDLGVVWRDENVC